MGMSWLRMGKCSECAVRHGGAVIEVTDCDVRSLSFSGSGAQLTMITSGIEGP